MKVVIIGGGTAGISTATHLRRKDENARIVVLEKATSLPLPLAVCRITSQGPLPSLTT